MFVVRERAREGRNGVAEMLLQYTEQRTGAQGLSKVCATSNDLFIYPFPHDTNYLHRIDNSTFFKSAFL